MSVWATAPFLGFNLNSSPIGGTPEDTVGIIGPPRCGKTSGLIIPNILMWSGPAVITSTRSDVVAESADRRLELASQRHGRVMVYDPFRSDSRFPTIHWSPISGCEDASICNQRVTAMAAAATKGGQDEEYWRTSAARILRPLFHAAALASLPLSRLLTWLESETRLVEATAILRGADTEVAQRWADGLDATLGADPRTRDPVLAIARTTLEAAADPIVLESCANRFQRQ